jgi:hypothetical protein
MKTDGEPSVKATAGRRWLQRVVSCACWAALNAAVAMTLGAALALCGVWTWDVATATAAGSSVGVFIVFLWDTHS